MPPRDQIIEFLEGRPRAREWGVLSCDEGLLIPKRKTVSSKRWQESAVKLVDSFSLSLRMAAFERELKLLRTAFESLKARQSIIVPVESLAPQSIEVLQPFQVVITSSGDEYLATFFDANISAGGETREEAYANLKDLIGSILNLLEAETNLGPGPSAQLAVLRKFMKRVVTA